MSRWVQQFENHAFQSVWKELLVELEKAKVDDETIVTAVQEIARLKKVITYVDKMLSSIDPELVPKSTWDNINNQAGPCRQHIVHFNSNRNINHIQSANDHADNLLTYVRPYMIAEGKAGKILQEAAKSYAGVLSDYLESFKTESAGLINELNLSVEEAKEQLSEVNTYFEQVEEYKQKLLGDDETEGIADDIDEHARIIKEKYDEINSYYNELLEGDSTTESIKNVISEAEEEVSNSQAAIQKILSDVSEHVKDLSSFHQKVFGKINDQGDRDGGILKEFENRVKKLGEFESKQIDKYSALNAQIESLLPGATSAGLSTAYRQMKRTFDRPIRHSETIFYSAVASMVLVSFFVLVDSVSLWKITFASFETWDAVFKALSGKFPLYGALIWLAFFASKRRSEYQRLQQEYAHKEALAKSYNSYKKQLELLDGNDREMQKEFIKKAIDAVAYNASQTLDGKHGDSHPFQSILERLAGLMSDIKSSIPIRKD